MILITIMILVLIMNIITITTIITKSFDKDAQFNKIPNYGNKNDSHQYHYHR